MKLTVPELVTLFLAHDMERTRVEELLNEFGHENYQEGKATVQSSFVASSLDSHPEFVQQNKITLIKLVREHAAEVIKRQSTVSSEENPNGLGFAKNFVEKYFGLA